MRTKLQNDIINLMAKTISQHHGYGAWVAAENAVIQKYGKPPLPWYVAEAFYRLNRSPEYPT